MTRHSIGRQQQQQQLMAQSATLHQLSSEAHTHQPVCDGGLAHSSHTHHNHFQRTHCLVGLIGSMMAVSADFEGFREENEYCFFFLRTHLTQHNCFAVLLFSLMTISIRLDIYFISPFQIIDFFCQQPERAGSSTTSSSRSSSQAPPRV